MIFLIELLCSITTYIVGGMVVYRSKWIETEKVRRRGELPRDLSKRKYHSDMCYEYGEHSPCCFWAFWRFIFQTDQQTSRPTLNAIVWPILAVASVAVILAKVAWFFVPVRAIVAPGRGLKGWLHPEVKIADKAKLAKMEKDLDRELAQELQRQWEAEQALIPVTPVRKVQSAGARAVAKFRKGHSFTDLVG